MGLFQHQGITFNYEVIGEGLPFFFSHGLTGNLQSARELLGEVPECKVTLWDNRAHGKTGPIGSEENLSFKTLANDMAALMDHLEINNAAIGGISMGASIVLQFAVDYSERLLGLVCIRPAWLPDQHSTKNLELLVVIGNLLKQFGVVEGSRRFQQNPTFVELVESAPEIAAGLLEQFHKPNAVEYSSRLRRLPLDRPLGDWGGVDELCVSTLVIGTEDDPIHPVNFAKQWAHHIPGSRYWEVTPKSADLDLHIHEIRKEIRLTLETIAESQHTFSNRENLK